MYSALFSTSAQTMLTIGRADHHLPHSIIPSSSQALIYKGQCRNLCISTRSLATTLSYPHLKASCSSHGVLTLKKPKLDVWLKSPSPTKQSPELDTGGSDGDDGIGGGDIGGGGGNDDDEYHIWDPNPEDGDEENKGIFRRRRLLPEIFDKETTDAVLGEWMKTKQDLPVGLQSVYELGLLSSAQFTKFLCFNAWPSVARFVCRSLPQNLSRAFGGKVIADAAFPGKLLQEIVATTCCSILFEYKNRGGDRFREEWDLVLINTVTASICNAFVVWSLAPCYVYGNACQFQWQSALQKLPNNVFETSYRLKVFDSQKKVLSFFYKAIGLLMFGSTAGAAHSALSTFSLNRHKKTSRPLSVPAVSASALDCGLFLGLHSNIRYQLLCGIDRMLVEYFDVMGVALMLGSAGRILNAWTGVNGVHLGTSREVGDTSRFALKNAFASLIGLVDPTNRLDGNAKVHRKRIARKNVAWGIF